MTGIRFVTDEAGERVGVLIDLTVHAELWEEFRDLLECRDRDFEEDIPFEEFKSELRAMGKLDEVV